MPCVIKKDILPIIDKLEIEELTIVYIQTVIDRIEQKGSAHVALLTRNVLKRMLVYVISRGMICNNSKAAIKARYIAQASSREMLHSGADSIDAQIVEGRKVISHKPTYVLMWVCIF